MKRGMVLVLAVLMAAYSFAGGAQDGGKAEKIIIKIAYGTAGGPIHDAALEFEKRIEEKNPQIDVQVFPGGQLGSEGEIIGQLQAGMTDILPPEYIPFLPVGRQMIRQKKDAPETPAWVSALPGGNRTGSLSRVLN
jgi:TRAP-type C4-dicarboxylate transport system substrate-binding protein